jgi:hypothetical protein
MSPGRRVRAGAAQADFAFSSGEFIRFWRRGAAVRWGLVASVDAVYHPPFRIQRTRIVAVLRDKEAMPVVWRG